jgi:hypothetical protein
MNETRISIEVTQTERIWGTVNGYELENAIKQYVEVRYGLTKNHSFRSDGTLCHEKDGVKEKTRIASAQDVELLKLLELARVYLR